MKNMKKLWALLLALAMVLSLAACGGTSDGETATDDQTTEDTATDETTETDSDLAYVQDKGSLVVGITYFAPMDYKAEGSDEWIGLTRTWPSCSPRAWAWTWSSRRSPGTTRWRS